MTICGLAMSAMLGCFQLKVSRYEEDLLALELGRCSRCWRGWRGVPWFSVPGAFQRPGDEALCWSISMAIAGEVCMAVVDGGTNGCLSIIRGL